MRLAAVSFSRSGVSTARRLKAAMGEIDLYCKSGLREEAEDRVMQKPFGAMVEELFRQYDGIIFIMAVGIVVREIAPCLRSKLKDPAVVVIDDLGQYVISLLSGHWGGANALTRKLAGLLQATPVITTATDLHQVPAFDLVAKEYGLNPEGWKYLKEISGALVDGERIGLFTDLQLPEDWGSQIVRLGDGADFIRQTPEEMEELADRLRGFVVISHRAAPEWMNGENSWPVLFLRPRNLIAGIGFRRGKDAVALRAAIQAACRMAGVSPLSVRTVATIDRKADEPGLSRFAAEDHLPIQIHSTESVRAVEDLFPVSPRVMEAIGVGSVAEPAAYLTAGAEGKWILRKQGFTGVTVALMQVDTPLRKENET